MPKKPTIKSKLRKLAKKTKRVTPEKKPLWKGPIQEGVTQSMISTFLVCRERFRVKTIEGLGIYEKFSKALEYGNMWHICEEYHHGGKDYRKPLLKYVTELCRKYPADQDEILKFYKICLMQFPIYLRYWDGHEFGTNIESVEQELTFEVPYKIPDGRVVKLKGKFDGILRMNKGRGKQLFLQENKVKGTVDEIKLQEQLSFDLQTSLYLIALETYLENENKYQTKNISGVCYNVIRRPLAGGKGSIRRHKPTKKNPSGESLDEFVDRLKTDYIQKEPESYFFRWRVEVDKADLNKFKSQVLDPVLTQICDWYDWISSSSGLENPFENPIHWRHPYGVYNLLNEGGTPDIDAYLNNGNKVGLKKLETLFPELESEI